MRKKLRFDAQTQNVLGALGLMTQQNTPVRFDAGEGLFILQELQAIEQQLYETPFGLLKAEKFIPFQLDVPAGAQEWGYDRVTGFGLAQWIAADAKDLPTVNVDRQRVTFPIEWHGTSYTFTLKDLKAAAFSNMPLEASLAREARRAIDSHRNRVLLMGDATVGFSGFINDASVTQDTAANGAWDGSAATPDEIIQEFNRIIFLIGTLTKENYWPDTLLVPPMVYSYLTTTPRSATSDTTIWEFMRDNNQYIKSLDMLLELGPLTDEGGTAPGEGATGRAIFYKKSPDVVVAKIATMFEQLPPERHGFSLKTPCYGAFGGVHWRVPIAGYYLDGVR
jgi:hypothetical protein